VKQLTDFTGPSRNNAVMTMTAKALTKEDVDNVSAIKCSDTQARRG